MFHSFFHVLTVPGEEALLFGMDLVTLLYAIGAIAVLCLVLQLGHILRHRNAQEDSEPTDVNNADVALPSVPSAPSAPSQANDDALIAVITAAISAAMAEQGYTGGFRVVSFKRAPSADRRRNRF